MTWIMLFVLGLVLQAVYNAWKAAYWDDPPWYVARWPGWFGKRAITLPPFGIWSKWPVEQGTRLYWHELRHWEQWQELGFWRTYMGYGLLSLRYGTKNHPREVDARAYAEERMAP